MRLKIISWNVNGLRSVHRKNKLRELLETYDPDIVCLQEIKCDEPTAMSILKSFPSFKDVMIHESTCRKGYAGVLVMSKVSCDSKWQGFSRVPGTQGFGTEGRLATMNVHGLTIVSCYTPNSKPKLERLRERVDAWEPMFLSFIQSLGDKTIVMGDLNVAPSEKDIFNAKLHTHSAGFTLDERQAFKHLLDEASMVDTFRMLHPDDVSTFTYWSYFANSRERNRGWRIDHALVSADLAPKVLSSQALPGIQGSDHCPIMIEVA